MVITKLASEQATFYQEIISSVPPDDLLSTEAKIQDALEKVEN